MPKPAPAAATTSAAAPAMVAILRARPALPEAARRRSRLRAWPPARLCPSPEGAVTTVSKSLLMAYLASGSCTNAWETRHPARDNGKRAGCAQ
ncbi:hypothetical protein GCM10010430_29400 [Kitasatospora cystarginea]|uniref:Uncharacterized protein n=1 Tax=Kitasatospora cystarginea TaxID=58350 RepID=A0ABP5QZ12_9ACTN